VWTSALLHVLTGLGLEEPASRRAIARAADTGLLATERHGRMTRWYLTEAGAAEIDGIFRRTRSLSVADTTWQGQYLIVLVTVSRMQAAVRRRLYGALEWAGFGNPAPGVWASPHLDRWDELKNVIEELELRDSTLSFIGSTTSIGVTDNEIVRRAWDLDNITTRYEEFIDTFEGLEPRSGDDVLLTHIALVNEWQRFPSMDPQLPDALLPDWIGRRAAEVAQRCYEKWVGPARERWREVAEHGAATPCRIARA
jgi:phenylacetic acid degradation operon negative regulatory protein